jgi:hypothetical protein
VAIENTEQVIRFTQGMCRDQQGIRFVLPAPRLRQAGLIFLASFFASRLQHEVGLPAGRQAKSG